MPCFLFFMQDTVQDTKGTMEDYFKGICPKYVEWSKTVEWWKRVSAKLCSGKHIREVCNFGVNDLSRVHSSKCLFANKFNLDVSVDAIFAHFSYIIDISEAMVT